VLTAVFLGMSLFSRSVDITWVRYPTWEGGNSVYRLLNQHQRARVMRAVELYREEQGAVPSELSDLVRVHLLREDDLSLWGRNAFSYTGDPPDVFRLLIVPTHGSLLAGPAGRARFSPLGSTRGGETVADGRNEPVLQGRVPQRQDSLKRYAQGG